VTRTSAAIAGHFSQGAGLREPASGAGHGILNPLFTAEVNLMCCTECRTYLINTSPFEWSKLHRLRCTRESSIVSETSFAVGCWMDTNTRQIALTLLESLREDVAYARLNNGSRVRDVADLRQYIYEQMVRIRTAGLAMDGLYSNDSGHGQRHPQG
jgi:hypothetical protein